MTHWMDDGVRDEDICRLINSDEMKDKQSNNQNEQITLTTNKMRKIIKMLFELWTMHACVALVLLFIICY